MNNISTSKQPAIYNRIILKISGEVLRDEDNGDPINPAKLEKICHSIKEVGELGVNIGLVVGGGNIFRGLSGATNRGIDRTTGDYMGMLATVINGLAVMDCLERMNVEVRVLSALSIIEVAEPFIRRRASRHLEKSRIVIFVAGTGNPYFSTDTAAALRASEIGADIILKATNVDGVYDKDPAKHNDAVKYNDLSFNDAINKNLKVMDATAFSHCRDNNMPILVFNLNNPENIKNAVLGVKIGTLVQ